MKHRDKSISMRSAAVTSAEPQHANAERYQGDTMI
jgi:hypothetical protein